MPTKTKIKTKTRRTRRLIQPPTPALVPMEILHVGPAIQEQEFPAEALLIILGQAIKRLIKGEAPQIQNRISDSSGDVWHAHIDMRKPRVKVFRRRDHYSAAPTVDGFYVSLDEINRVVLRVTPIEYVDGKEVDA